MNAVRGARTIPERAHFRWPASISNFRREVSFFLHDTDRLCFIRGRYRWYLNFPEVRGKTLMEHGRMFFHGMSDMTVIDFSHIPMVLSFMLFGCFSTSTLEKANHWRVRFSFSSPPKIPQTRLDLIKEETQC